MTEQEPTYPQVAPYPFVQLEGTPYEVGRGHGSQLGERIAVGIADHSATLEASTGVTWERALKWIPRLVDPIRDFAPDLVEEMEGIADGAEQTFEAIVALNARTTLGRLAAGADEEVECSTAAALPESTADGTTYLFGNWDQNVRRFANAVVLEIHTPGRPAVLMVSEAGRLMLAGLNDAGLGINGNSLWCTRDQTTPGGIPWPVVRRRFLQHTRLAPAIKSVYSAPRTHSGNHMVASAEGFAVDLEATPGEVFAVSPVDGVMAHSNHFLSPAAQARIEDTSIGRSPSTLYRHRRIEEVMRQAHGSIDADTLKLALRDHFGYPDSVCAHPEPRWRPSSSTIASSIMDLERLTLEVASGPPCVNPYVTYQLPSPTPAPR
jgi:isopenicillin-N N-acyltransferase like protein